MIGDVRDVPPDVLEGGIIENIHTIIDKLRLEGDNSGINKVFYSHVRSHIMRAYSRPQFYNISLPYAFIGGMQIGTTHLGKYSDPLLAFTYLKQIASRKELPEA